MEGEAQMYPDEIFLGLDLYSILIIVGCILAIAYLRIFSGKVGLSNNVYNVTLFSGAAAIIGGYALSVVVQAIYNWIESGKFELNRNTGATFYGGLVCGAAIFFIIYFGVGHFMCKKKENLRQLRLITDIAAGAIAIAHAFGRIGCLMAGCCYGKETESWIGVYNVSLGHKTVPVQLFESVFLMCLFVLFTIRLVKKKTYNLPMYMVFYGIWRFFIEYARDDDRGATIVRFLSPSQLTAVFMVIGGIILFFVLKKAVAKEKERAAMEEIEAQDLKIDEADIREERESENNEAEIGEETEKDVKTEDNKTDE